MAAATVSVAGIALFVASPWRGGPNIIDRAAAAVAVPTSDQILYESISIRVSLPRAAIARIERRLGRRFPRDWAGHAHLWIEGARPHRFRLTISGRWSKRGAAPATQPTELGGTLSSFDGLDYDPDFRTLDPVAFDYPTTQSALDPAAFVRAALTSHRAQIEGTTTIRGHEAIRILVRARVLGQLEPVGDYFVDARTYRPLRVVIKGGDYRGDGPSLPGMPLTGLTEIELKTLPPIDGRYVFDFTDYRRISPTAANRRLTDIQAMHPHAKID